MSEAIEEQKRQAYNRGMAYALNGRSRNEGRSSYKRNHEIEAFDRGYFAGYQKRNSYKDGGEDD